MPKNSRELLDQVDRPSLLDSLLLDRNEQRDSSNPKERPLFTPLPDSQALGKVRDFLAVIAKANKDLEINAQENPCSNYDIEVLSDDEKEYIEMDLLLGVADLHSSDAVAAAKASMSGFRPTVDDGEDVDYDDGDGGNFDQSTCFKDNTRSAESVTDFNESSREAKPNKRAKVVMLD